jgi:hypothetical protein
MTLAVAIIYSLVRLGVRDTLDRVLADRQPERCKGGTA